MYTSLAQRPGFLRPGFAVAPPGSSAPGGAAAVDTFNALTSSGAARLPSNVTINSVLVAPTARYEGASLTGTDGTLPGIVGPTLTTTGAGASVLGAPAPFTGGDAAISMANGKSLLGTVSAPVNAAFDLAANDFVLSLVVATTAATSGVIRKTNSGAVPGVGNTGWQIALAPTSAALTISDGVTVKTLTATLLANSHNVVQFYVDKSEASVNGGQVFVNGALNASLDMSGIGSISAPLGNFQFGSAFTGSLTFFSVHQSSAWFAGGGTNATQWLAAAREVNGRLEGSYATTALGTATALTSTRSSAAYLDRIISTSPFTRQLFLVGANWSRLCRRRSLSGATDMSGGLQENQSTNLCLRSEEFDNASWTKVAATISANGRATVTGETIADGIIGDGTLAQHGVTQAITLTAVGYIASFFVEAGNQNFCFIENATIANGRVWFNLSTGAVATKEAGITEALIEPYGIGRFRISARFTGTVAAHTIGLNAASADNVATFTGDAATVNLWAWGAQVETAPQDTIPSTYVATTTASATRTLDTLQYKTDDGNYVVGSGRLEVDVLYTFSKAPTNVHVVATASASSGSTTDSVFLRVSNSTGFALAVENIAGAAEFSISGTTNNVDGEKHTLTNSWAPNAGRLLVDAIQQGATDVTVTVLPAAPPVLTLGSITASAFANALIGNVKLRNAA
jgi:hypothetical protein